MPNIQTDEIADLVIPHPVFVRLPDNTLVNLRLILEGEHTQTGISYQVERRQYVENQVRETIVWTLPEGCTFIFADNSEHKI